MEDDSSPPISIYVDGSCIENRNVGPDTPAGWGFVVVSGDRGLGKGTGDVIYEEAGKVVTNKEKNMRKYLSKRLKKLKKETPNSDEIKRLEEMLK